MTLLLTLACTTGSAWTEPLWDPGLAEESGVLYARLPHAEALARLNAGGQSELVDLDGATPDRLVSSPDASSLLVFSSWLTCRDDDPKIETVEDCLYEDRETERELALVQDGQVTTTVDIAQHLDTLAFSPDGRVAVAYLGGELSEGSAGGLADVDSVTFIDLQTGEASSTPVGFAPGNILFTPDGASAVVLSRSTAVLVDMDTFQVKVTYDLTLDNDTEIDPSAAVLTPDGSYALVAVARLGLLYKLDLVDPSIDIEELAGAPSALVVDELNDVTVITYSNAAQIDLLYHSDFSRVELDVDEVNTGLVHHPDGFALAYREGGRDVYAVDLATEDVTEYVVANPVDSVQIDEAGRFGLAIMRPEYGNAGGGVDAYTDARWGMSVLEIGDDEARNVVFEQYPTGIELVAGETTTHALVLLEGERDALLVDLADPYPPVEIALEENPLAIGSLQSGMFWITQNSSLGLVTVLDPLDPDNASTLGGFAGLGLITDDELPRRGGE